MIIFNIIMRSLLFLFPNNNINGRIIRTHPSCKKKVNKTNISCFLIVCSVINITIKFNIRTSRHMFLPLRKKKFIFAYDIAKSKPLYT